MYPEGEIFDNNLAGHSKQKNLLPFKVSDLDNFKRDDYVFLSRGKYMFHS